LNTFNQIQIYCSKWRQKMFRPTKFLLVIFILWWALAGCRAAPSVAGNAAVVSVAAGDGAAEASGERAGSITIAVAGPLTGGAAFIGEEIAGFTKAVAAIYSEAWGIPINVVEADSELNPDTAKIVAEQFVANEAIIGVIGPVGSQECEATQPVFAAAGLAHVTPSCTATALTQPGTPTFFRPIPHDAEQSKTIAGYLLNTLAANAVYIVDDQSSYSVSLSDEVEQMLVEGGVRVERASVTQEESDFSALVTTIIAAEVDVVLFPSQIAGQQSTLAVQLREQGFEGIYFLGDGGFTLGWVESAGEAADGTFVTFFAPDPNLVPEAAAMNERFRKMSGVDEFGAFGGAGGLSAQVLLEAIGVCVDAGTVNRACVVDALTNLELDNTVLGIPVAFGEGNQAAGGFSLFQVQDGAFVLVD
jgi:branched-chain amino acid transport system substrate-binding protein